MIGFVIWSAVACAIMYIGILALRSDKPVGFFAGVKPPEVEDVKAYNRAVALLWFGYAAAFELLGLPLLFGDPAAVLLLSLLGVCAATAGLGVAYTRILRGYEKH